MLGGNQCVYQWKQSPVDVRWMPRMQHHLASLSAVQWLTAVWRFVLRMLTNQSTSRSKLTHYGARALPERDWTGGPAVSGRMCVTLERAQHNREKNINRTQIVMKSFFVCLCVWLNARLARVNLPLQADCLFACDRICQKNNSAVLSCWQHINTHTNTRATQESGRRRKKLRQKYWLDSVQRTIQTKHWD